MTNNTLLVDGTNLFIIHLTANPSLDLNGVPNGAVKGFLSSLCWIVKILKPTNVAIFFDGSGGSTQRRSVLSEYKEGRRPITVIGRNYQFSSEDSANKNRQFQFKTLQNLLEFLPVNVIVANGFETDDGIAYAVKFREYYKLGLCTIVSCDRDFYQLVDNDVLVYNPMSKKLLNSESIISEFEIHPKNWLFYRSISGDKSDNIDGVKGFGPKTLLKMFDLKDGNIEFGPDDIENLYSEIKTIENKSIQKRISTLYENKQKIERNWKLMSLHDPMLSSFSKNFLDSRMSQSSSNKFLKLDFYRELDKIGIYFDGMLFDSMKLLLKASNK